MLEIALVSALVGALSAKDNTLEEIARVALGWFLSLTVVLSILAVAGVITATGLGLAFLEVLGPAAGLMTALMVGFFAFIFAFVTGAVIAQVKKIS